MAATQIVNRQIADGAIDNAKVNASAAIATSKLADSANFILRGGTVAFTGNQSLGSNKITSLANGTADTDAATYGQVKAVYNDIPQFFRFKPSARAKSTANVTISNPGTSSFDGVTLASGELLLLNSQSTAADNGLYTFNGSGSALTRHGSMDSWAEVVSSFVTVEEGTANADTHWFCTANQGGTLGSTSISFTQLSGGGGLSSSNFVYSEAPSGSINGSNTSFTLANTPTSGTERLYLNGVRQFVGGSNDYTISGATITMNTAPLTGERLIADYMK